MKQLLSDRFRHDPQHPPTLKVGESQLPFIESVKDRLQTGKYKLVPTLCPCDGGGEDVVIAEIERYGLPLNSVLCRRCGSVRFNPYIDDESLVDFYVNWYQQMYGRITTLPKYFKRQTHYGRRILAAMTSPKPAAERLWGSILRATRLGGHDGLRVLEVGCGAGGALSIFRHAGHRVTGCEYSEELVDYARQKGVPNIFAGPLTAVPKPAGNEGWDLIYLHHVFEHLNDPLDFLVSARRYLAPGGRILVIVPDIARIDEFAYPGGDLLPFLHLGHKHNFSIEGFRLLGARAKLDLHVPPPEPGSAELWVEFVANGSINSEKKSTVNGQKAAVKSPGETMLAYLIKTEAAFLAKPGGQLTH